MGSDGALRQERDAWKALAEGRADLLMCYRLSLAQPKHKKAIDRIDDALMELRRLGIKP